MTSVTDAAPPHTEPTHVLRVSNVDVVREGRHLLADLSVTVGHGQHWAVLGPNGAGKTTLLNLLGATAHPTRGQVQVLGHRLGRVDMATLRTLIGHVDPRHRLEHPLHPVDVVLTGLTNTAVLSPRHEPRAEDRTRALRLLQQMGMQHRHHTAWTTMSQGERGRVLIARALMSRPRLLLLDEPATGLDIAAREHLLTALATLTTEHPRLSSVQVTHHLEELPATTTHALLLRDGRCVAQGPIEDALTSATLSTCFDLPLDVSRQHGRWSVRSP